MRSLWRAACIVALIISAVAGIVRLALAAQGEVSRGPAPLPHAAPAPATTVTAPPLPFGNRPSSTQTITRSVAARGPMLTAQPGLKRPGAFPTVADAMRRLSGKRSVRTATGATVILVGTQNVPYLGGFTYIWDGTLQYGDTETLQCQGMTPNTSYRYVLFTPKTNASPYASAYQTTDASGNCTGTNPSVVFSTPYGSGTDAAYPGVWAVAMQKNGSTTYDTIVYIVVLSSQDIIVSSDAAGMSQTNDFTAGSTVYVNVTGLNPSDSYALAYQYTGNAPIQCRFTLPTSVPVPRDGPCFNNGTTVNGITPTGGNLTVGWNTATSNGMTTGAYSITLADVTIPAKPVVISTHQISIQPAAGTPSWTLTPYNGTTPGTNLNDTFAFDGYPDQSVTGADFKLTGLTSGHSVTLTISDPNGSVLVPQKTVTASAGTTDFTPTSPFSVVFPLKTSTSIWGFGPFFPSTELFGPIATKFGANVYTAQVYDNTSSSVVASKSFKMLAYWGNFAWTNPTVTSFPATNTGSNETITVSNPGVVKFGDQTADTISGIKISSDGNETIALQTGVTTALDKPSGHLWNLTYAAGTITATPTGGAVLDANTTLDIPVTVTVPTGNCVNTNCILKTQILPTHGIAYSGQNNVSNSLFVSSAGSPYTEAGTAAWSVTATPAPLPAGRSAQAMYAQGAGGTTGTSTYNLNLVLNNTSTDPCETIASGELTLPPTFTANNVTLNSVTISGNGCTGTCGWIVGAATLVDPGATGNMLYIWDSASSNPCSGGNNYGNYIPRGGSATFNFTFPMWTTTFAPTPTVSKLNLDGGCPATVANANCTGANALKPFTAAATGTVTTLPVPNTTTLDSTTLTVYSLNPALMKTAFSPSSIGSGAATTTVWQFTNTPTSADPNPDYIDKFTLTPPVGMVPDSISGLPSGWGAYKNGANWVLTLCGSATCTPTNAQLQNAIPPGGVVNATFNYTTTFPANGNYTMTWTVEGANGAATSSATPPSNTPLVVSSTSAAVSFSYAGGYTGSPAVLPTPVPGGQEPAIGSDADKNFGNSFVYTISNNGNTTITAATITIPYQDRYFVGAPSPYFTITAAPNVSGAGAAGANCSGNLPPADYASSTSSANGNITLSGCNIKPGQSINVYWDMKVPYSIGSEYVFPTLLNPGASQANATAAYAGANFLKIILDARLAIITPPNGTGTSLVPGPGGSTPSTSCLNCVVNTGVSPATINFGTFQGTFTATDLINASVTSDAGSPDGWQLYVSSDINPTTQSGNLLTMASTNSNPQSGGFTLNQTAYAPVPTTAPGLLISTFSGATVRAPIDTVMDYRVNVGATVISVPETVTLTYTLIVN